MDFELSDEQRLIRDMARDFATRVLAPRAAERDRTDRFPTEEIAQLGELGLLGVNVPEALGGTQAGALAYSLCMTELARADASVTVAVAVTNMVAEVLAAFAPAGRREELVPALVSGALAPGAFALSEVQAGSDPQGMRTVATPTATGYRLDGAKQWITSGDRAGVIVVWARTPSEGPRSISAFAVRGGTPGLTAGRHEDKLGLRGSSTVALALDGVEIDDASRLGAVGDGMRIALRALDGGRIGIGSQALGIGFAALDAARSYAKQRQQFGQALADFQAIQFMLADTQTELEAARLLVLRAAWLKDQGRAFTREASMAKLYATEAAWRATDRALQIHGGYGYTKDFPVERYLRDVRVTRIYEGTSEVQRIVIARALLEGMRA